MLATPDYSIQIARSPNATGLMRSFGYPVTDTFSTLKAGAGVDLVGLHFEQNTGKLILQPEPRWVDLRLGSGAGQWTGTSPSGVPAASWREVQNRSLDKWGLSQESSKTDVEWSAESNDSDWLSSGASFCVNLSLWPAPKAATHDRENWYRHIVFPSDAEDGELRHRVSLHYGEEAVLEWSTDGSVWIRCDTIPTPLDLLSVRAGSNAQRNVTVSVLQLSTHLVVWLGQDFSQRTLAYPISTPTLSGKLKVEGKNGRARVDFADLRFRRIGYYDSYWLDAPRLFETLLPRFYPNPSAHSAGHRVTGRVIEKDLENRLFRYRATLEAPPVASSSDPEGAYAATTPEIESFVIDWPSVSSPPPAAGWRNLPGDVEEIYEHHALDFQSGLITRGFSTTMDNTGGEWRNLAGVQAAQFGLGYTHSGVRTAGRGRGIANVAAELETFPETGKSEFAFRTDDLTFLLKKGHLRSDLIPSFWCPYALFRFLAEQGGIVPALLATIPDCPRGPNPPCPHVKFPPHPLWEAGLDVIPLILELREAVGAIWGQDTLGQMRFEPFRFRPWAWPKRIFREIPDYAFGQPGGAVNHCLKVKRIRDLDRVRNEISLIGFEQSTGEIFLRHYQNLLMQRSLYDPSSPNYLGFSAPLLHVWSGYSTKEFADYSARKLGDRISLPAEEVVVWTYGQPDLFPGDLFQVNEYRTVGSGSRYYLTDIQSSLRPGTGQYVSTIHGVWVGPPNPPPGSVGN